jgi:DNA-binding CsgD family transcriptional regulator
MLLNKENIHEQLSHREMQVIDKILEGLPNKLIARQLFISERTVKFHCSNIYRKLDVVGRYHLASLLD